VSCRRRASQHDLIRLTCDHATGEIHLNPHGHGAVHGRSAYLCRSAACVEQALKGTRLKQALAGRKKGNDKYKRTIRWPLEAQLMKLVLQQCTQAPKTWQNTQKKEGAE